MMKSNSNMQSFVKKPTLDLSFYCHDVVHCACLSVTVIPVLPTCFNLSFARRHSLMWNISQGCTTGTPAPMHGPPFATSVKIACPGSRLMASPVKVGSTHKYYTCLLSNT